MESCVDPVSAEPVRDKEIVYEPRIDASPRAVGSHASPSSTYLCRHGIVTRL